MAAGIVNQPSRRPYEVTPKVSAGNGPRLRPDAMFLASNTVPLSDLWQVAKGRWLEMAPMGPSAQVGHDGIRTIHTLQRARWATAAWG